jgi:hypothetical protein
MKIAFETLGEFQLEFLIKIATKKRGMPNDTPQYFPLKLIQN